MSDEIKDLDHELSEDEIVDAVAEALAARGLAASSQDTGGGINCVVLEHKNGGEIVWGTADLTWGAAVNDADGEYVAAIETSCPSDSRDPSAITEALYGASIINGAVQP